jgi:ketosteroid isomerase-like protein
MASASIAFLFLALPGCASPRAGGSDRNADLQAILVIEESGDAAVSAGDVDGEVARFAEDGIYMWPDAPEIVGRAAIRAWFSDLFERAEIELDNRTDEVEICGDWAYTRGHSKAIIRPKDGGAAQTSQGKYINIFHRQPDGSWRITRRIRNLDHAPGQASTGE